MKVKWVKEIAGKEEVVARAKRIIGEWGLTMPEEVVLAMGFGLGDFYQTGEIEFWVANETKNGYCGKFLFLFPKQTCPAHHHKKKHETFYLVKGRVRMNAGREKFEMVPGDCYAMSPGVVHTFTAVDGPVLILEVSKPCEPKDSIFIDKRIGRI